jgi:nitroimidazol reductase NimA-like FMN-containing flavoprotein (pyridoxamine 5'-phosphate oxidase superfamily)
MPGYGVPADDDGVLPWPWAEARLIRSRNFWVVTVSGQGRPHAMPVWGVWLADLERFAFSCSPGSRKARNIAENDHVVVAVDDTVETVSLEGVAATATDDEADAMVAAFVTKYEEDDAARAALAELIRGGRIFVVTPERAFGIIERPAEFSTRATRWTWETS